MPLIPFKYNPLGGVRLPKDYARLKSIYCTDNSSGMGYLVTKYNIDTGYRFGLKTVFEFEFDVINPSNSAICIAGSWGPPCQINVGGYWKSTPTGFYTWMQDGTSEPNFYVGDINVRSINRVIIDGPNKIIKLNDIIKENAPIKFYEKRNSPSFSFYSRHHGNGQYGAGNWKIFGARFKEDDILIHDYIPAQRRIDGRNGLYDTITGTFLDNQLEKNFLAEF